MPEEIKGLIEKIQKEGVEKAREDGRKIVEEARKASAGIIEKAKQEADAIIQKAKEESGRAKESTEASLRQAGRDLLISLRAQINALLKKVITHKASEALTPQEMAKMIQALINGYAQKQKPDKIEAFFSKDDLAKMKDGFLGKLSEEAGKGITLKSSDDISAGFTISFDSGKSHFDFSDQALADYISGHLNKELAKIFNLK